MKWLRSLTELISIEDEKNNVDICDFVVDIVNKDYESATKEILERLSFLEKNNK